MSTSKRTIITALRIALGAMFLYAGVTKLVNPEWSAAGYLAGAKTLPGLYEWFASEGNIWWINIVNEWGLTLIGAGLITGLLVTPASIAGIAMMVLYYLVILDFPYAGPNSLIIDSHIINILVFLLLIFSKAGTHFGLDKFLARRKE